MLAFQVSINGKLAGTFGFEDWSVLLVHLRAFRSKSDGDEKFDELHFGITGIAAGSRSTHNEHVDMLDRTLGMGDVLEVKILESDTVAPPARRYTVESTFTEEEWLEAEREDYRRLKTKFEPGP